MRLSHLTTLVILLLSMVSGEAITVSTIADEDDGNINPGVGDGTSLREAIKYSLPGSTVVFDPALDGQVITLGGNQLLIDKSLNIDASSLPNGITIDADEKSRVFEITPGSTVLLHSLTIYQGETPEPIGGADAESGGGIHNSGNLTIVCSTLWDNDTGDGGETVGAGGGHGGHGGAIYNLGTLYIENSTFYDNSTGKGGEVDDVTGSPGGGFGGDGGNGGGIYNDGSLVIFNSTFSRNLAGRGGDGDNEGEGDGANGSGGGIYTKPGAATLKLHNVIIADNNAVTNPDLFTEPVSFSSTGVNIIGDLSDSGLVADATLLEADPLLAPLGNYGGATKATPPLPGSPAINAGGATNLLVDQRGLPRGSASYSNDFSSTLAGASLAGNAISDGGSIRLTSASTGQTGSLTLPPLGQINALTAAFDFQFTDPGANNSGNGLGFILGPAPAGSIDEEGPASGLVVTFDTQLPESDIRLKIDGTLVATYDGNLSLDAGQFISITTQLDSVGNLTVTWNNITVFDQIPTSYTPQADHVITFGASTGTDFSEQRIDNITVLANPTGDAPDIGSIEMGNPVPGFNPVVTDSSDTFDDVGQNTLSLREAITFSSPGDTITFDQALDGETVVITGGEFHIDKDLSLSASALANGLVVDANGDLTDHRVLRISANTTVVIDGLTLTGGKTEDGANGIDGKKGGGIYNSGHLSLRNSTITGNRTGGGGDGLNGNSAGSHGGDGGGIYNDGTLILENSTLSHNYTGNGGEGAATDKNNENQDDGGNGGNGGGICNNGIVSITNSTIVGNHTGEGGCATDGIEGLGGSGGGIYSLGTLEINHTTLSQNQTEMGGNGGGICIAGGSLNLSNSIVADNQDDTSAPDLHKDLVATILTDGVNLIGDLSGSGLSLGSTIQVGDPLLTPLGHYGGPTQTMVPLAGSPVIDAATTTTLLVDQRHLPRNGSPDIGAIESGNAISGFSPVITDNSDLINDIGTTTLSLREALTFATPGQTLTFDPSLDGATILITDGEFILDKSVTIDASALPNGLTIDANGDFSNHRVLTITPGSQVILDSVTLTGGKTESGLHGGAIYNGGNLTILRCTVSQNTTGDNGHGGGIYNDASAILNLTHATFSGNNTKGLGDGGAIYNDSTATVSLQQSTLSNNTADEGGGIFNAGGTLNLANSLVAHNAGNTSAPDISNTGSISPTGVNLLSDLEGSTLVDGPNVNIGDPHLASLGNYGGPTDTMPPMPGSPAIDQAGTSDPGGTDQRGASRFLDGDGDSTPALDIGAVEYEPALVSTQEDDHDSPEGPTLSLREAIAREFSSSITFSPTLSSQSLTLVAGPLHFSKSATIDASGLPKGFTIHGNDASSIINIDPFVTVSLDSLTITGGSAEFGGGIVNAGDLHLHNTSIVNNAATNHGGGIYNTSDATLTASNTTISQNLASEGGGIYNSENSTTTLSHTTISGNASANSGGGLCIHHTGELHLSNTIVAGNFALTDANIQGVITSDNGFNLTSGSPLLAPLGSYGGPTQTMPPLAGSPAIDPVGAPAIASLPNDQRGFARLVDGDLDSTATPDIGAVEAGPAIIVVNTADSGAGSLRQALTDAAGNANTRILFDGAVFPDTISLASGQLEMESGRTIFLDASNIPDGVTIAGGAGFRALGISAHTTATLHNCTLQGGNDTNGGATQVDQSSLTMISCSLTGNNATTSGGAIHVGAAGSVALHGCTIANNNSLGDGGALSSNGGITEITNSTLADNIATSRGGAYWNTGTDAQLKILSSTITNNHAGSSSGGGGINNDSGATAELENSIVYGNTHDSPPLPRDLESSGFTVTGANIIGSSSQAPNGPGNILSEDPLLSDLGSYGGLTETSPPLPGSPAIDLVTGVSTLPTDQRGTLRVSGPGLDLGAVELQEAYVNTIIDENDGFSTNAISLRDAIAHPTLGEAEVIRFDPALSGSTILLLHGQIPVERNIFIDASGLSPSVTISGDNNSDILTFSPGTTTVLDSLTISDANGSALHASANSHLSINRCTLSGNIAGPNGGAAIYNESATVVVNNSTVTDNSAPTSSGGAIVNDNGSLTLNHVTLVENSADNDGGGIYQSSGSLAVINSILTANTIASGTEPDLSVAAGTVDYSGQNITSGDPLLSSLADYGGPTKVMTPAYNSPALDSAGPTALITDQRGFSRQTGSASDIGAVELQQATVNTVTDENDGLSVNGISLREAIAAPDIEIIAFHPSVFDGEPSNIITLSNGQLTIDQSLTIDASALDHGVIIDGNDASRIMEIDRNATVLLQNLTLTGGRSSQGTNGGGIYNCGSLTLIKSTVSDNHTGGGGGIGGAFGGGGGAIFNSGDLTLSSVTVSENSTGNGSLGGYGGGIYNIGANLSINNSTITGNHTGGGGYGSYGGGIYNASTSSILVENSTITENHTSSSGTGGIGGGIYNGGGVLSLTNTIIANNQSTISAPDIRHGSNGTIIPVGVNLITDLTQSGLTGDPNTIVGTPHLAPLGRYGGTTETMPPLPGSLAIDAAGTTNPGGSDQREEPRFINGSLDIGAVEYQGTADANLILPAIWELDDDGDGIPFGLEFATGTDPHSADMDHPAHFNLTSPSGDPVMSFGLNPDAEEFATWILKRSYDLTPDSFVEVYRYHGPTMMETLGQDIAAAGTATSFTVTDENPSHDRAFYRFEVELIPAP